MNKLRKSEFFSLQLALPFETSKRQNGRLRNDKPIRPE